MNGTPYTVDRAVSRLAVEHGGMGGGVPGGGEDMPPAGRARPCTRRGASRPPDPGENGDAAVPFLNWGIVNGNAVCDALGEKEDGG